MRLVCIGDSLIEYFDWQGSLPGHEVLNLGIGGETVQELLGRLEWVTSSMAEPDRVLIMSGINNVAQEDYGFPVSYRKVLAYFRKQWPGASVGVNCLLPVRLFWVAADTLPRLNADLKSIAAEYGASFLDIYDAFLDEKGVADAHYLLPDGVHLSDAGYNLWSALVKEWLAES